MSIGDLPMAGALLATGVVVAAIGYCTPRRTPKGVLLAECAEADAHEEQEAEAREEEAGMQADEACAEPTKAQDEPADWETALVNAFGDALVS